MDPLDEDQNRKYRCASGSTSAGSLVSSQYEREISKGKKPTTVTLTSWQIRANVLRKLNRAAKEPEGVASGSQEGSNGAPF